MSDKERITLWIALAVTLGCILFMIFFIFPHFKDDVTWGTSRSGEFSYSNKALLIMGSSLVVFLIVFSVVGKILKIYDK